MAFAARRSLARLSQHVAALQSFPKLTTSARHATQRNPPPATSTHHARVVRALSTSPAVNDDSEWDAKWCVRCTFGLRVASHTKVSSSAHAAHRCYGSA